MKIKPLADYVFVEPIEDELVTKSGIILPETSKELPQMGRVMEVSDNVTVKAGDKVFYKKWGGNEVKVEGKLWILISEEDILATIEDEE